MAAKSSSSWGENDRLLVANIDLDAQPAFVLIEHTAGKVDAGDFVSAIVRPHAAPCRVLSRLHATVPHELVEVELQPYFKASSL